MLSPFKCITRSSSLSMEETKLFAITIVYFLLLFAVIRSFIIITIIIIIIIIITFIIIVSELKFPYTLVLMSS